MQHPHPRDYRLLAYFNQIATSGSIRGAARAMGVSAPVMSTALSDLEALVGTALVIRGSRQIRLTDKGEQLRTPAALMVGAATQAMAHVAEDAPPSGAVALTLPLELSLAWLPDRIKRFQRDFPAVTVTIHADDAVLDMAANGIDMAVRATPRLSGPRPLGAVDTLSATLVAAPTLLEKHGLSVVESPDQLAALPLVSFSPGAPNKVIRVRGQDGETTDITMPICHYVNNAFVAREFAIEGFGVALILRITTVDALNDGRLVELLPRWSVGDIDLSLIHRDRLPTAAARVLGRYLADQVPAATLGNGT